MSNPAIIDLPERVRDRDIFRDYEGRLFVSLGYIQPADRVLSYLKYMPDTDGKWVADGVRYKRTFWGSVDSTVEGMVLLPQNYTILDKHFQTVLVEPPRDAIKDFFSPENRLWEIVTEPKDTLEELVKRAADILQDELGVPLTNLGISGSILWKGHDSTFSDINMNIYGFKESWNLHENYTNLENHEARTRIRALPEWKRAIGRVSSRIPILNLKDLQTLFSRRKALCIDERCIGITPVILPEEAPIEHESESYLTLTQSPVKLSMMVENADYGIFHPAIYTTEPVMINKASVTRIMVYDGAFGGLFKKGDQIEVAGMLQRVTQTKTGVESHQLMVGTKVGSGKEYIKLLS